VLSPFNFSIDVPGGFLQVCQTIVGMLEVSPPDILNRIAQAKAHVLSDLNALNTARMGFVVIRISVILHSFLP
jgi:hypothetical protein